MQEMNALIKSLNLQPHPEGGFYKEVERSKVVVLNTDNSKQRSALTSIYYLLGGADFSSWHRVASDETWYFHDGCDVVIYFFDQNKTLQTIQLGSESKVFQKTISANTWFAARPLRKNAFCLVSCAVAPGFEFDDFEIAKREALLSEFGFCLENIKFIEELTRI
jgi:predicted cupin superfamily sugar epimerase